MNLYDAESKGYIKGILFAAANATTNDAEVAAQIILSCGINVEKLNNSNEALSLHVLSQHKQTREALNIQH